MQKLEISGLVELDRAQAALIVGGSGTGTYWQDIKDILHLPPMQQDTGL
jgi:hypothetical protein